MTKKDIRIDAYIAKAATFAQPIVKHLRKLIHQGCPEVLETINGECLSSIIRDRSLVSQLLKSIAKVVFGMPV